MKKTCSRAVLALLLCGAGAFAQDKAESPAPRKPITPLNVQLVLSHFQGEKKVGSLPYTLTCNADDRQSSHLRMGIEVPVPMTITKGTPPTFNYKSVGTNIDCRSTTLDDGRFRVELTVEHSSIYSTPGEASAGAPLFRTFRSGFVPIMRNAQTAQYTAATDPVTGEVVKIDVTLTVLK
jgi:hypothetical protein